MTNTPSPLRVGIGGPVGSGKTALLEQLCRNMRDQFNIAVVTNDIYTREDAEFLIRHEALTPERIVGVETGGCPHTAIREDASMNLAAVSDLSARFPGLDCIFVESGGDNLSATFSPELADLFIYVIDVSAGDKIPRKGGPGITRSDLLVINKPVGLVDNLERNLLGSDLHGFRFREVHRDLIALRDGRSWAGSRTVEENVSGLQQSLNARARKFRQFAGEESVQSFAGIILDGDAHGRKVRQRHAGSK